MENVISLIYYSAAQTFSHSWKFMHLGETVWILFFLSLLLSQGEFFIIDPKNF